MSKIGIFAIAAALALTGFSFQREIYADWQLGPFERVDEANPIIIPSPESVFFCPLQQKEVQWESENTFNPGAVVRKGKVYLFYRAEDNFGHGIGKHTSRIGQAESSDGINFQRGMSPVLFPALDDQSMYEFPGGCEDPQIVETEEGSYVMTYTQWNRQVAVLGIATSIDLVHWKKRGYAFEEKFFKVWSKSGSIVCRVDGDRLIAAKINGKYWMYWGEGVVHAAISDDLISWEPIRDEDGMLIAALVPREGKFDSLLVESGPPAIVTPKGILLLYNGKNSIKRGDLRIPAGAYSGGQVLFDLSDPTKIVARCEDCFLTPERPYEKKGQYATGGTVFIQGLVHFQNRWLLYYGTADTAIGVASTRKCVWERQWHTPIMLNFPETSFKSLFI